MNLSVPIPWRSRGFSQVEVLIVISAMALLSAIAFPIVGKLTGSSQLFVLKSNLDHMNTLIREAHRAGPQIIKGLDVGAKGNALPSVSSVCTALTDGSCYLDSDGDGNQDSHEFTFGMDMPENENAYDYLIGQHLTDGYTVKVHGEDPFQLAIFENNELYEVP